MKALPWLLLGACFDPTQIVVVVGSDLASPNELARYEIRVRSADGTERMNRNYPAAGDSVLPASFGVAPLGDDPQRMVEVEVVALGGSMPSFSTEARTSFVARRQLRLDMYLSRRCAATECEGDLTCRRGECEDPWVPPESLPPFRPGDPLDQGEPDAAVDAGLFPLGRPGDPCGFGEECEPGVDCYFISPTDGIGICRDHCSTPEECAVDGSLCGPDTRDVDTCMLPCDPFAAEASCPGLLACTVGMVDSTDGTVPFATCRTPGETETGAACLDLCVTGSVCADSRGCFGHEGCGTRTCRTVCRAARDCGGGTCVPLSPQLAFDETPVGVCVL